MIHCEYDEKTDKSKLEIDGSLGKIYAEIGLIIVNIANNEELMMTTDDVIDMIKESIEYNLKRK